jgi:hypothetical protein
VEDLKRSGGVDKSGRSKENWGIDQLEDLIGNGGVDQSGRCKDKLKHR